MVDIMIVRKRMRQPSVMGRVALSLAPLCVEREVELHEGVPLDDADQHDEAHERVDVELDAEEVRNDRAAIRPRGGPRGASRGAAP